MASKRLSVGVDYMQLNNFSSVGQYCTTEEKGQDLRGGEDNQQKKGEACEYLELLISVYKTSVGWTVWHFLAILTNIFFY